MNKAIEAAGLTKTKVGSGDKEEAYAVKQSRLKAFLGGIVVTLLTLVVLIVVYATMYNDERVKSMFQLRETQKKLEAQKEDAVRLGMAIHAQNSEKEAQERESVRMFKRIGSVIDRKFAEMALQSRNLPNAEVFTPLLDGVRKEMNKYVKEELEHFEKDAKAYDDIQAKRLGKLSQLQEQSMRELLKSVSGVKMEALEDMLSEVFDAANKAPKIAVDEVTIDAFEDLADGLYEERITLEDARKQFDKLRSKITGWFFVFLFKLTH